MYPGKIITTFHYVPRGASESNLFVRTFMLGARSAFAQLCKRARVIIVNKRSDKVLLADRHGYPASRIVAMEMGDMERVDWASRTRELMKVYKEVGKNPTSRKALRGARKAKKAAEKKVKKDRKPNPISHKALPAFAKATAGRRGAGKKKEKRSRKSRKKKK